MVGKLRKLLFKVSIVINICVLFYAVTHLSGGPWPIGVGEWDITASENDFCVLPMAQRDEPLSNESVVPSYCERIDPTLRNYDESTSQKTLSTAPPTINNTAFSTATVTNKKAVEIRDKNIRDHILTESAMERLQGLLHCNKRDFLLQKVQRGKYSVLTNYIRAEHGPVNCYETITYTTHAGFEFLDNVKPLVERWSAPVSLAIYAPGSDFASTVDSIRYLRDCLGTDLIKRYVTFHVFFPYRHIPSKIPSSECVLSAPYTCQETPPYVASSSTTYRKKHCLLYPINVARNIARDAALTHFVLPSDIELYPSPNMVPKFLDMIARNGKLLNTSTHPRVFPIALFEVAANIRVPYSKTELQDMLKNKTAIPFHKNVCPDCHNIPQGQQWMKTKESEQMDVFHVGKRRGIWEPIFIGTHQDPHYDERLSWEGMMDKMPQGYVLCVEDYDFMILNNAFLIHKPGIRVGPYVRDAKRKRIAGRQTAFIRTQIEPELKKLFGTRAGCAL